MSKKKDKYGSLKDRTNKRLKDKDSFPGGKRILTLPEGAEFYKPKKGRNEIEILPYEITTENHPDVAKGEVDIGDIDYVLDIYVHRGMGVNNSDDYVCPSANFGKPCPICEEAKMLRDSGVEKETTDKLRPKRRVVYNILDHEDEKVKLFMVSHFLFEKELQEEREANNEDGEIIFAHPKIGKTIRFRAVEEAFGKNTFFKYKKFDFLDRDEPIDVEVLEDSISLDSLLVIPTYDELKSALHQNDEEDYEDDEEEEEEEKPKRKTKKQKSKKCPDGFKFGVDTDEKDECNDCECWDECDEEKNGG
jgi:hypothetical protein